MINPWLEEALKKLDQRRREVRGIPLVVECEPGEVARVAEVARRMGYKVYGIVLDFVFVDVPGPEDVEKVASIPGVRVVSVEKPMWPMALGVDEMVKRISVSRHPLLSQLSLQDLADLGIKPPQSSNLPVLSRVEWKLVTETRALMEAPADNEVNVPVGVIDSGARPGPGIGLMGVDYECISMVLEPPVDTMSHGSWVHSCAFGRPALTRYGSFEPVSRASWVFHVKVFPALGPTSSYHVMRSMNECAKRGCRVVNMSLGGPLQGSVDEDPECVMVRKLYERYGTIFVVATGNDGDEWSVNSPATSPYAIAVASVDWKTLDVASYSSRGPQGYWYYRNRAKFSEDYSKYGERLIKPDVAGVGGDSGSQVVAAACPWYDGLYDLVPDGFEPMTGTSMATPHVSGLVALAIDRGLVNRLEDVYSRVSVAEKDYKLGYGLLKWGMLVGRP